MTAPVELATRYTTTDMEEIGIKWDSRIKLWLYYKEQTDEKGNESSAYRRSDGSQCRRFIFDHDYMHDNERRPT